MSLSTKAVNAVHKVTKKSPMHGNSCGNCIKCYTPVRDHWPAKDSTYHAYQKTGYWKQKCRESNKAKDAQKKPKPQSQYWCWAGGRSTDVVGFSEGDPAFDKVMLHAWLANQNRPEDPKQVTLKYISIGVITEAFATVDMPVASKKRASLQCKVNTSVGGNIMPIQAFAKLFPNWLMRTGIPTGLQKCNTKLRTWNLQWDKHSSTQYTGHPSPGRMRNQKTLIKWILLSMSLIHQDQ